MRSFLLNHYDNYAAWASRSLALWDQRGRDALGGCYEHLHKNGIADDAAIRRHRIQARQVFSFVSGQTYGWYDGQDTATEIFEFMCLQGWSGEHFIHRIDSAYKTVDGRCDLYDHAFYLLGAASLYGLTGHDIYKQWIERIIQAIDKMRLGSGGWAEDNLGTLPRRQNPHMHLFEVHLYLYETTNDIRFLQRAEESLSLFKSYFYDAKNRGIIELFDRDWTLAAQSADHGFEPGHTAEWIWLLGWYDRLTGHDHSQIRLDIFDHLSRQAAPYLMDKTDFSGMPPHNPSRRLWVQTEWIKAHLILHEDGYTPAAAMLPGLLSRFMQDYLTPDGLWRDQFNAAGADISATIPTSTQYHIIAMIIELKRVSGA